MSNYICPFCGKEIVGDEVLSFDDRVVAAEELERAFGGACSN